MTRGLLAAVLLVGLAASAGAQDANAPSGRGWIIGGGITAGTTAFTGAEGMAVAVGPVVEYQVLPVGGQVVGQRQLDLIDASAVPPADTVHVAPIPRSQGGGALTLHVGYAFSPRVALLADMEFMTSVDDGFGNGVLAAVLRYRPARRVWIEAGPSRGDLAYGYQDTGSKSNGITGSGFLAAGGISVLSKERWTLDVQGRYAKVWYPGFQARNLSFGLSIGRVRSGTTTKPASRAAAPRGGASRG
jgi:opacity protein-like surface antigen